MSPPIPPSSSIPPSVCYFVYLLFSIISSFRVNILRQHTSSIFFSLSVSCIHTSIVLFFHMCTIINPIFVFFFSGLPFLTYSSLFMLSPMQCLDDYDFVDSYTYPLVFHDSDLEWNFNDHRRAWHCYAYDTLSRVCVCERVQKFSWKVLFGVCVCARVSGEEWLLFDFPRLIKRSRPQ